MANTIDTTKMGKLYCYPLIIPNSHRMKEDIDNLKTEYQSIKINYYEDSIKEQFIFYIFPSTRTNDVEELAIYINGSLYEDGIILDMIRNNISTNRYIIPFKDCLTADGDGLVEFRTTGERYSVTPIYVHSKKLTPLFIRDLGTLKSYTDTQETDYISPYKTGVFKEYKETPVTAGLGATRQDRLFKLSGDSNIYISGYSATPVYNTFYIDEANKTIVTHNTITAIRTSADIPAIYDVTNFDAPNEMA